MGKSKTLPVLQMFADVLILYVENPKDTSKKTVEVVNKFNKLAGHKINENLLCFYTNNKLSEKLREQLHL